MKTPFTVGRSVDGGRFFSGLDGWPIFDERASERQRASDTNPVPDGELIDERPKIQRLDELRNLVG